MVFRIRREKRLAMFSQMTALDQLPSAEIQLGLQSTSPLVSRYNRYYRQFLHHTESCPTALDPAGIAMLLPLNQLGTSVEVVHIFKKKSANFWRESEKARKTGFIVQPFLAANHTVDLLDIRRSKKIRSFGVVLESFTLKLSDLGGAPTDFHHFESPTEDQYWDVYFGVFKPIAGYQQGKIVIGQRLVAYARLHRIGNVVRYAELMGHAEFQRQGVMNLLHCRIVKLLIDAPESWQKGIHYLSYGALEQGSVGLCFWKRKALFQPMRLVLNAV